MKFSDKGTSNVEVYPGHDVIICIEDKACGSLGSLLSIGFIWVKDMGCKNILDFLSDIIKPSLELGYGWIITINCFTWLQMYIHTQLMIQIQVNFVN